MGKGGELYILVGLPGAGKSTWARKFAVETGAVVVSFDFCCDHMWPEPKHPDVVYKHCRRLIAEALGVGQRVIFDHVNTILGHRLETLRSVGHLASRIACVWVTITVEDAIGRALAREAAGGHPVPMDSMMTNWRFLNAAPPSLEEGYDELVVLDEDLNTISITRR